MSIGKVYLEIGEAEKAREVFSNISQIDAIFEEKNKHFFNECAIQLRKQKLYNETIGYYEKAISVSPNDENLCFNLARANFDNGNAVKARECINKALQINPDFIEGKAYIKYMEKLRPEENPEKKSEDRENEQSGK